MLSSWHLIIALVVVLLLFGHRLPGMARALGSGITEFKRGLKEGNDKQPPADQNNTPQGQNKPQA